MPFIVGYHAGMNLFQRQVITRLIPPGGGQARELKDLRTSFDIKMSMSGTPNQGTIQIWNPAPDSVSVIEQPGATVELYAGYDVPTLLFRGNPSTSGVALTRPIPDRVLKIEAQDGGDAYTVARVTISTAAPITAEAIVAEALKQANIPSASVRVPPGYQLPSFTFQGSMRDLFTRLASLTGARWFLRDGGMCFLEDGADTGEKAIVISSKAGNLIGSPVPKDGTLEVKALLSPTLRPGMTFYLESLDYNGFYVASDVKFQGDSGFDTSFYMTTVGSPKT